MGNNTEWAIVLGQSLSGKSLVASVLAEQANGKIIDAAKIAEAAKSRLDTEEQPFEGRVPDVEVEKDILNLVSTDKNNGNKFFYIFDGQYHESVDANAEFLLSNMGAPRPKRARVT